jgi:hypothetical protein
MSLQTEVKEEWVPPVPHADDAILVSTQESQSQPPLQLLWERTFEIECRPCNRRVSFQLKDVHASCASWRALLWNTPDEFRIKCSYCFTYINVRPVLPTYAHKYL